MNRRIEFHEIPRRKPAALDDEEEAAALDEVWILTGVETERDAARICGDDVALRHQRPGPVDFEARHFDVVRTPDDQGQDPIAKQQPRATPDDPDVVQALEVDRDVPGVDDVGVREEQLVVSRLGGTEMIVAVWEYKRRARMRAEVVDRPAHRRTRIASVVWLETEGDDRNLGRRRCLWYERNHREECQYRAEAQHAGFRGRSVHDTLVSM